MKINYKEKQGGDRKSMSQNVTLINQEKIAKDLNISRMTLNRCFFISIYKDKNYEIIYTQNNLF